MISSTGMIILILCALVAGAALVTWLIWSQLSPNESEKWPVAEGTIQSVGTVVVNAGRRSHSLDVGDFSYTVNDEYYSGRLKISSNSSTGDDSPRNLVHQKIKVRYNPQKPGKYSIPPTEVGGFLLDSYSEGPFSNDVDPIDLNIDKA
jgi:hypothetical protein